MPFGVEIEGCVRIIDTDDLEPDDTEDKELANTLMRAYRDAQEAIKKL